jgi:multidrug efflux pump
VVALAGVVVGNNIVLIDAYAQNLKTAFTVKEAAYYTGVERFRPVLLTSGTAIVGLLPTALGIDIDFINREVLIGAPQGKWWAYLAQAICYGLIFAKGLTLIVTPCALLVGENVGAWWHKTLARLSRRDGGGNSSVTVETPIATPDVREAAE